MSIDVTITPAGKIAALSDEELLRQFEVDAHTHDRVGKYESGLRAEILRRMVSARALAVATATIVSRCSDDRTVKRPSR